MHPIKVNLNGKLENGDQPLLAVQNRGFRYGDGLFETMKCKDGAIALIDLHFERLFNGMEVLMFQVPDWLTPGFLSEQIHHLLSANNHQAQSRVRLMIFRGNGGLYDADQDEINFLIESFPLIPTPANDGLIIGVFPNARKSQDIYASIKSNNFLPYVMAALYAKTSGLDDAVVLNTGERISDTTIANIFLVKNHIISTPALSEGCVAGVMRRYLLGRLRAASYDVAEVALTTAQLFAADEVFLTNAVAGIRSVKKAGSSTYHSHVTKEVAKAFLAGF